MAFGTAKLTANTFGSLRGGTPEVYPWKSSECNNGGCGDGVVNI